MEYRTAVPRLAAAVTLCLLAAGCTPSGPPKMSARIYAMGEQAQVGALVYTVTDADYLDQLGDAPGARTPKNRFLAIRLSVTNGGAGLSGIPPMSLHDSAGNVVAQEVDDAEGLAEWLGSLRHVQAAETIRGRVLFDVPPSAYRLRVSNDADPDNERAALVDIPLHFTPPPAPIAVPVPAPAAR